MPEEQTLIVIYGPTGVGKTAFAMKLCATIQCPIICADSRQIYENLHIGAASPTIEEKEKIEHLFFNERPLDKPITSVEYTETVDRIITQRDEQHLVICGGTGFYIDTLLYGLDPLPTISNSVANYVSTLESKGKETLQLALKQIDFDAYQTVDIQNPRKIVRALQLTLETGMPLKEIWSQKEHPARYTHIPIYLHMDREILYRRINTRVDKMIKKGLEAEVRSLYPWRRMKALQTVGYQELFTYIDGDISMEEATRLIKRNSRRYAKRQITWYRRNPQKWNKIQTATLSRLPIMEKIRNLPTIKKGTIPRLSSPERVP